MTAEHFSVEERVENFKRFYERKNERPLLGFYVGSEYPLARHPGFHYLPEGRPLTPEDFDIDVLLKDTDALYETHEKFGGDFLYAGTAFWGIPWVEASLGCPVYANHSTGSIYCEPPADFEDASDIPEFDPENPWMKLMARMYDALCEHSAGRYPIGTTRFRGISDLLSALYGGDELVFGMIDDPEDMEEACRKLTDYWISAARLQLAHITEFKGGIGSFYYYMWAPRNTVWYQEDTVALLSPALYKQFIEPCVRRIVSELGNVIIHEHPVGFLPYQSYADAGMTAMELHIDEGGPSAEQLYDIHRYIMDRKPLLIWGDFKEEDFDWLIQKLPPQGLALLPVVRTQEEADARWTKLRAIYK